MSVAATFRSSGATARSFHTRSATRSRSRSPRMSHAYIACNARERARVSVLRRAIDLIEEIGHLERGERRVPALVSVLTASARFGLRHRVARQDAEGDRDVEVRAGQGETPRRFARHVVEVRRIAANHRAYRDE